ncbi:unnamed protein product [Prorocentrum cordatum]|uniref:Uncharacterized protein n=1 Tax=Prorocentrum cordatum TaxID=2364126 RepID=A0ABN9TRQ3_9DINO|nr:unnamed protein product [Polarella glacialis]
MTRAAMTLLLAVTIRCALGAATVAADAAPRGQRSRQSTAARGHSHSELNGLEDAHPYRGHSAHGGEAAELHRTKGHAHHAAAGGPADKEKHATAAHARGSPTSAEEGSKAPEWGGGDASEASPGAEPEEDAEELDAEAEEPEHADAEDGAEDFEGPVEAHLPRRGRVHLAVDAAGNAAEVRGGGGPVMRRYNHTSGTDFDDLEDGGKRHGDHDRDAAWILSMPILVMVHDGRRRVAMMSRELTPTKIDGDQGRNGICAFSLGHGLLCLPLQRRTPWSRKTPT